MNKKIMMIIIGIVAMSICAIVGIVHANNYIISEQKLQSLSAEDKAVKLEISKYADTAVDFRKNMQQKIMGKKYDIHFVEINEYNTEKVIYKNDLGDEFEYNIETGKLSEAVINSAVVEKTDDSVDIDEAHRIAINLLPDDVDLDEYTEYAYLETSKGYYFWYVRYFGKYRSADSFSAMIGFDGSIVSLGDSTHIFNGKDINFDEKYITEKIDEFAKENGAVNIKYENATVLLDRGKICVDISYDIEYKDGTTGWFSTPVELE